MQRQTSPKTMTLNRITESPCQKLIVLNTDLEDNRIVCLIRRRLYSYERRPRVRFVMLGNRWLVLIPGNKRFQFGLLRCRQRLTRNLLIQKRRRRQRSFRKDHSEVISTGI